MQDIGHKSCGFCGAKIRKELSSLELHLESCQPDVSVKNYLSKFDLQIVSGQQALMHPLVMRQCPWCGLGCCSMRELKKHVEENHGKSNVYVHYSMTL